MDLKMLRNPALGKTVRNGRVATWMAKPVKFDNDTVPRKTTGSGLHDLLSHQRPVMDLWIGKVEPLLMNRLLAREALASDGTNFRRTQDAPR
jgi:hypothetical protein